MRIQKRTLFIGVIVWLLFFGWWFRGFLFKNWNFRLFSFKSWRYLFGEFRAGWHISSKSDWIFIFSFILAPFIFALLWYLAQKVKWRKLWEKIWKVIRWPFLISKKKQLKEAVAVYEPKEKAEPYRYRPQSLPSTGSRLAPTSATPQSSFLNNSTAMGNFAPPSSGIPVQDNFPKQTYSEMPPVTPPPVEPFTNESFAEMADTPLSEIEIPKMESVHENLEELLEKAGYTLLPALSFGEKQIDLVAVSAGELLIALYDKEKGDWLADEESFNEEDPLWFSETDHRISPVFELKQIASQLEQKVGSIMPVHPVLIEKSGTIINAEDMMKTWNDLGVSVCRTAEGGPVELPTCTEQFKETQEKISTETLEKIKSLL